MTAKELEAYDIGLMLTDVKIQDAEMPTDEVNEAYKAVLSACVSASLHPKISSQAFSQPQHLTKSQW